MSDTSARQPAKVNGALQCRVAISLRTALQRVTLKYMRRKFLCGLAACFVTRVLAAQPVPARDLWDFPLGAVLEPAAIASEAGTGVWNPASIAMPADVRLRAGVASLSATANQGIDAQLAGVSFRRKSGTSIGISVARAAIGGITRTDADPTAYGSVTYSTLLVSGTVARQIIPHVSGGVSARYREGTTDLQHRSALAADLGIIVDSLPWRDARVAVSSFLWRPGRENDDRPAFLAAVDARIFGTRTGPNARLGYLRNVTDGGQREHGPFVSAQTGPLEVRAALVNTSVYGHGNTRARSGLALHYARYVVGIGREEGIGGIGPLYQFTLSSIVK